LTNLSGAFSLFSFAFASRLLKNSPFVAAFEIEAELFSKREGEEKQGEFWIESARVTRPNSQGFYSKLSERLAAMDFAR